MELLGIDILISHPFSATFSGGVRSCLGWRFACVDRLHIIRSPRDAKNSLFGSLAEMQTFLVTLIRKFDFSPADHHPQIRRARPGLEFPLVIGEEHKGTQLPLKITAIRDAFIMR